MSSWAPTKYKTRNWPSYNTALKQRGSLSIWFDPEMVWVPPPSGKRGRQCQFSDAAIQACLTLKVLFGMPLRQTTGFVGSLLRLAGLDWAVPDYSTLCRRQKTLNVSLPYRGGTGPLNLLIDSTGIKSEGEGEWNARKHGGPKRRIWRKIHIGIDEETLEVRAVEVTTSNVGDAPMLPELLGQIPPDQGIGSVTAPSRQHPSDAPAGQWTAPTTRENAMTQLPRVGPMPSFRPARTPNRGSPQAQEPSPGTRQLMPRDIWAGPSGDDGVDTTAGAVSRAR